jgi:transposase
MARLPPSRRVAIVVRQDRSPCALIHAAIEKQSDITLDELRTMLAGQGVSTSTATLWRSFARHPITRKKRRRTPASRTAPMS